MSDAVPDEDGCIRRVLVAMMIADDDIDPDEIEVIRTVYTRMTGHALEPDELRTQAERMREEGTSLATCVETLTGQLSERGKQRVLAAAFAVATADGFVLEEEDRMLAQVGRALGLREAEYKTALHDLMTADVPA